jgi:hypothetical protein
VEREVLDPQMPSRKNERIPFRVVYSKWYSNNKNNKEKYAITNDNNLRTTLLRVDKPTS